MNDYAPVEKKSNRGLIIGIIVVVVLCCCCVSTAIGVWGFNYLWSNY